MSSQMSNKAEKASGAAAAGEFLKRYADWIMGLAALGLLVTLIVPVAPWFLDLLIAFNLTTGVLLLMVTMNAKSSSALGTFPTILLFATLFRLGLNVASTRLILTGGQAGKIISAFGEYVGGDNLMVGMIVFLILIIIQFVVITKGSGRISEVAARFVLDAMPGKQMAIDADLNSGLIDADQARDRRATVSQEAEFYGAMDGASKFVRGDAIAGLIITGLNLVGGIAIGSMGGMGFSDAVDRFSKLTIGDGLVSQIPALFISTAAGILVTKSSAERSLGQGLMSQVGGHPKATLIASGVMFAIGLMPGMPKLPFFVLATVLALTWRQTRDISGPGDLLETELEPSSAMPGATEEEDSGDHVEDLLPVDRVSLEIGYQLLPLVQDKGGNGILEHIAQLRRRFATQEGVVLPPVRIKDNIRLNPAAYRVLVGGQEVASGELEAKGFLAMDGGTASGKLVGKETVDPAFGLPAWWIDEGARDEAEIMGFTVIDATSVLVTHLSEILRSAMGEVLTRDDVKELVENVRKSSPAVVEELLPEKMGFGEVQQVLKNLLAEGVSVRNMPAILEVLADHAQHTKDPQTLTELVRQRLGRALCETHADRNGTVHAVTLDPTVEHRLASAVGTAGGETDGPPVDAAWLKDLMERVGDSVAQAARGGKDVVLLVRSNVRRFLNELVQASLPKVAVLSYNEVVPAKSVETVAIVRMED
ncbi:MAG: flagellar biosynthesis protein FlhA [Planctomycetes bacterium]|nr:flagellar biosynthesis protein FlhA [Planctomycetota bacterium]